MRFIHAIIVCSIFLPHLAHGQDQPRAAWRFAQATWGCSLNLALREQPDAANTLSDVELSYLIASTNPSATFRIPENELTFSVTVRGYDEGETTGLELFINGTDVQLEDRQFADRLSVYTASPDQARYILEAMESGAQIVLRLQLVTGTELTRTLHDGGFENASRLFRECL